MINITALRHLSRMAVAGCAFAALAAGCGAADIKPVDLYPEDMCALCRMAVSDPRFAAEIITDSREVLKFDDIGCMETYTESTVGINPAAVFVKDFGTEAWVRFEQATIVRTGVFTPMGSGKVAFADAEMARDFAERHPEGKPSRPAEK